MKFNLHTHTKLCRHASGEMEEYVKRAIESGLTHLGFSDHMPRRYEDGYERSWKVQTGEVQLYLDEARRLWEKYADEIRIYVGYEAEYYPECSDTFLSELRSYGAEYVILGEHFTSAADERDEVKNRHTVLPSPDVTRLEKYCSVLKEAIKTGLFTYIAHPDIIGFTGAKDVYSENIRGVIETAKEYNVPLEINLLGMRELREYPRRDFWELAGEIGAPVTVGCDAHRAIDVCDIRSYNKAIHMIDELGLNYVGMPEIKFIK